MTMSSQTAGNGVDCRGDEHEHDEAGSISTTNLVPKHGGEPDGRPVFTQAPPPPKGKYADVSFLDRLHLVTVILRLPFIILWFAYRSFVIHPKCNPYYNPHPTSNASRRSSIIALARWLGATCNYREMQYLFPPSVDAYLQWTKAQKLEACVERLVGEEEHATVLWVGRNGKRADRVVLYLPGGAYFFPVGKHALSFWRFVQLELKAQGIDISIAVLAYTRIPEAGFPTQLRQAQAALEHILASGVHPSDLHLVGDSAGGNLVLALLSHIMHPLPADCVGPFRSSLLGGSQMKGVYLMSPWVCVENNTASASVRENSLYDIVVPGPSGPRGEYVKKYLTSSVQVPYLNPLWASSSHVSGLGTLSDKPSSPSSSSNSSPSPSPPSTSNSGSATNPPPPASAWFAPLNTLVDRVLMTAGEREIIRDDIVAFAGVLRGVAAAAAAAEGRGVKGTNERTQDREVGGSRLEGVRKGLEFEFVLQKGGVHVDPLMEFMGCGRAWCEGEEEGEEEGEGEGEGGGKGACKGGGEENEKDAGKEKNKGAGAVKGEEEGKVVDEDEDEVKSLAPMIIRWLAAGYS